MCCLSACRVLKIFEIYSNTETFMSVVVSQSISGPESDIAECSFDIGINFFGAVSYEALNHFLT